MESGLITGSVPDEKSNEPSCSSDTTEVEHQIIALARASPKGIMDKQISEEIPDLEPARKAKAINKLLAQGLLDLFNQNGSLIYKLKDLAKAGSGAGAGNEEKLVYSVIEQAGNHGIWVRDIRTKSNMLITQLNKVLKAMENKKMIKSVNCVNTSKKKVYMLYDLQPHPSVTGGAWYTNQDFDAEFVDILTQQCHKLLVQKLELSKTCKEGPLVARKMASLSCEEVVKFVNELGISKVKLSPQDLESIMDLLVYDGKAERTLTPEGKFLYRAVKSMLPTRGLACMPCGVCPIFRDCGDVGAVRPKDCQYLSEWLD